MFSPLSKFKVSYKTSWIEIKSQYGVTQAPCTNCIVKNTRDARSKSTAVSGFITRGLSNTMFKWGTRHIGTPRQLGEMHRLSVVTEHDPKGVQTAILRKSPGFSGIRQSKVQAENANVLREEIHFLLLKEAIQKVPAKESNKGFFSQYFLIPKKGEAYGLFWTSERPQIPEEVQFQNADTQVPAPFYTKMRLVHLNRSERCLLPYTDPSPAQTISKVCSVRPVSSTPHFHNTSAAAGHKDISVSRWLVIFCRRCIQGQC